MARPAEEITSAQRSARSVANCEWIARHRRILHRHNFANDGLASLPARAITAAPVTGDSLDWLVLLVLLLWFGLVGHSLSVN